MSTVGAPGPALLTGDETPQEAARAVERLVRVSGATGRALSGSPQLVRRSSRWYLGEHLVPARSPHVHPTPRTDDWVGHRGATDAVALLVRHSDPDLFLATTPGDDVVADLVFALLEQLRVESLADPSLPGVAANLERRFAAWTRQVVGSDLVETEQGLLVLTVAQICRSRVLSGEIEDQVSDLIEPTRFAVAGALGAALVRLRPARRDQAAYAVPAAELARSVAALLESARASEGRAEDEDEEEHPLGTGALSLLVGFDEGEAPPGRLSLGRSVALGEGGGYRVFTRRHDRCDASGDLVPAAERAGLVEHLTELVRESGLGVARLARAMGTSFAVAEPAAWELDLEEGELDPSRLTRPVTRTGDARVFRARRERPSPAVAVTILLDCSGSMKVHRERLAPLMQAWGLAMNRAGLPGEILGHTTRTWGGTRARRDWQRAGRPRRPGRLSELQHLVLRDAGATRAREVQAWSMLRDVDYREGVDGEAIVWAAERLRSIEARRHVLAVVTDGSPMETSTARANDAGYLDQHLREVITGLERSPDIDLVGVGVGLDLSEWFGRYHVLDLAEPLTRTAHELLATLGRAR